MFSFAKRLRFGSLFQFDYPVTVNSLPLNITDIFYLAKAVQKDSTKQNTATRQTRGNFCLLSLHRGAVHLPSGRWPQGHKIRDVTSQGRDQSVKVLRAWCVRFRACYREKERKH